MNIQSLITICLICSMCVLGCKTKSTTSSTAETETDAVVEETKVEVAPDKTYVFPYNLSLPDQKQKLPKVLTEISGLDFLAGPLFACIQDEKANVYIYNWETDEITSNVDFGKNGDFEDIEVVGKEIWTIRSDGNLYQITNFNAKEQETTKYETHLSTSNDVEGLSLDASKENLLLACKGSAAKGSEWINYKAVYSFNLASKTLSKEPVFAVSLDELAKKIEGYKGSETYNKIAEFFNPSSGNPTFQPSGIDVHPTTKEIYLIATAGKLLLVLNPKGDKVIHIEPLDSDVFKQPEGICFTANGDLYISNEGRGGKGNILKFVMNQTNK